ncbi:14503_t:CDS:2, partial [Funneliformis mosseae]
MLNVLGEKTPNIKLKSKLLGTPVCVLSFEIKNLRSTSFGKMVRQFVFSLWRLKTLRSTSLYNGSYCLEVLRSTPNIEFDSGMLLGMI